MDMDIETILGIAFILIFIIVVCFSVYKIIYSGTVGNKQLVDMNYSFNKAIIKIGNEEIELKIKKWNDYEGEQIQIITEDNKVYLTSANNIILISEGE